MFPTLTYCENINDACNGDDLIVLATEWAEYQGITQRSLSRSYVNP